MDSIVYAAIEEVCVRAAAGIPVTELWPSLRGALSAAGLPPGDAVHKAIWVRFLSQQGIRFEAQGSLLCGQDPSIQSLGEAERIGVRIVAEDHLRDSFLGIYDLKASTSEISQIQRAVLERLAAARTKGVTQSELAKEFGIKANSFFYIVRNLECQQLIVRQSTIVRAKETAAEGDNAPKNISAVSTNLLLLRRYAKNLSLNSQQKFEITKGDSLEGMGHNGGSSSNVGESSADFAKGALSVKDYLPAIKAICDKLEESCGKVLVVSDIKSSLGYRKSTGHRAWRSVLNRLKDAHLVEEFQAEVNKKVVSCLRLLKKFDSSDFLHKKGMNSHDSFGNENLTKIGKRGDITDEFVELPTDNCIYDMVDAEGERGLTIPEISIRLGFTSKKLHKRLSSMRERFGMCWQAEIHERTPVYRIWTFENYPYHPPGTSLAKNEAKRDKNVFLFHSKNSTSIIPCSTNDDLSLVEKNCVSMQLVHYNISPGPDGAAEGIKCSTDQQRNTTELPILSCVVKSENTVATAVNNAHQIEKYHNDSSTSPDVQAVQRNHLLLTLVNSRREERIIKKLQREKFVLMAELYRWLEELDKGKKTKMCRKTLTKTLNRLQEKGLCKCIQVSIPVVTNFNRHRASEVILHPSVENLSPELLEKIYRKQRDFDIRIRVQASAKCRNGQSVQNLSSLSMASLNVDDKPVCLEAMRANGFVSARMVRAKLLHKFLWSYVNNSPNWHDSVNANHCRDDLKSLQNTCHLFSLDEAVKMMPLELFLQVVGSPKEIDSMVERCRLGLRLSDIPSSEYKSLFDIGATSRLSNIINVLVRMKLIQLVREGLAEDGNDLHAVLTYAMELRPYIEEPVVRTITPSYIKPDLRPRIRHDFLLLKPEAVDVYWETLEYCFVVADKEAASHAFPGSCAHEVFRSRSWTSLRVMTAEQRMELLKLLDTIDAKKKVSFKDCIKIARELKLTVEQVIRVSYDRRKSHSYTYSSRLNSKRSENHIDRDKGESFNIKRKRSLGSEESSLEEIEKGFNKLKKSNASGVNAQNTERVVSSQAANEIQLSASEDLNNVDHAVDSKMLVEHVRRHGLLSRAKQIPKRSKRFFWNDRLDRQLVMQYSRHRAISGARFYRVDWTSLADLPALPATCCRRMAVLNSNCNIRRAVMRLCNLLGERYAMYLERMRMIKEKEHVSQTSSLTHESYSESNLSQYFWDNFEDPDAKIAVDEVLRYKRLTKFGSVKRLGLKHGKRWPVIPPVDGTNTNGHESSQIASDEQNKISKSGSTESQQHIAQRKKLTTSNMSRSHHSQGNLVKVLNKRCNIMKREVCESLAIANAIELLKVILLGTSASPEVQCSLVATLQLYSENDIVAAFTYLKEKNFIVVGHGSRRFVLSKKFWHHASSSPFPIDSGKRADDFSSWLSKQERSLMEDGINLTQDLQCGEICHLFALVSSGELSISPCLPNEGIGEADEPPEDDNTTYSNNLKRKSSEVELRDHKKVKKLRLGMIIDNDYCSRREKGFPGIRVVIDRQIISEADTYMTLRVQENLKSSLSYDSNCKELSFEANCTPLLSNYQNSGGSIVLDKLPWADIIRYAEYLSSVHLGTNKATNFSPELFINVHSAVCQAGERGLGMQEISEAVDKQGRQLATVAVDTLEVFQLVIKVNSYENIRVLDSSYKSKYFIQSAGSPHEKMSLYTRSGMTKFGACHQNFGRKTDDAHNCEEPSKNLCDGHKVTILDLPSDRVVVDLEGGQDNKSCATLSDETMQVADSGQGKPVDETMQVADADQGKHVDDKNSTIVSSTQICCPILPWINGDGSKNTIVYKGLTRRLFGTIMQNPGILEEDIIRQMDVLNPQSCKRLIELMILDSHLTVRKLPQTPSSAPVILQSIFGSRLSNAQPVFRKHFFANPLTYLRYLQAYLRYPANVGLDSQLSIKDILVAQLIQLVSEGLAEDGNDLHAVLTYAMELRPYIEEPVARTVTPSYIKPDLRPRIRHDFLLLKPEAVDVYWETLEYCFVAADKEVASHAFPGSCAHEVFRSRSWTSLRVMTAEQRMELLKLLDTIDAKKKVSFKDCIKIARELKLTVEQEINVGQILSEDMNTLRPLCQYSIVCFGLRM